MGNRYITYKFERPSLAEAESLVVGKSLSEWGSENCVRHFSHSLLSEGSAPLVPISHESHAEVTRKGKKAQTSIVYGCLALVAIVILCSFLSIGLAIRVLIPAVFVGAVSGGSLWFAVYSYATWVRARIKQYDDYVAQHGDFRYVPTPSSSSIIEKARRENPNFANHNPIRLNDAGTSRYE